MDRPERHSPKRDLTNLFVNAASAAQRWKAEDVRGALQSICDATPDSAADWDAGAGEGWGRVVRGQDVTAYVCAWLPLIIARRGALARMSLRGSRDVVKLEVDDMSERAFSIDLGTLRRLYAFGITESFDPQEFSIDELWFSTV